MRLASLILMLIPAALVGCATPPPASEPAVLAAYKEANDPLEPANRFFYNMTDKVASVSLTPAARAYRRAVPNQVRTSVSNFFENLGNPFKLANDMLQGNPRRAGDTFMRFVVNSTIGVGGIFDIAARWGYHSHPSDFGMTLAVWGLSPGPYLYLPLLGPSDVRDALGAGANAVPLVPLPTPGSGVSRLTLHWTVLAAGGISSYSEKLPSIDEVKRTSLDPYATFRSIFRQHRSADIEAAEKRRPATVPIWFDRHPKSDQR
jgi:phospholipid-binding lipoprotein MlaA